MNLFKSKLRRKKLITRIDQYRENNKNNMIVPDYYLRIIEIIEDEFDRHKFESNLDFFLFGRRKFLVDEFYSCLEEENINFDFVFGSIVELLMGYNNLQLRDIEEISKIFAGYSAIQIIEKDNNYTKCGIICLEEKKCVSKMLCSLKDKLKN